mmetsp:Transcript_12485/g.27571  ORF Transcript_12485/g.27571 Transcript_12485/m.27571 type:complete len:88 (-) Transcript_12485:225-488(-)
MAPDEAERWIVDLIRNASLDAKIDSERGCVVMGQNGAAGKNDIHRKIVEKSKYLTHRTTSLATTMRAVMAEARRQREARDKALRDDD